MRDANSMGDRYNLGTVLGGEGQLAKAARLLREAAADFNLGLCLLLRKDRHPASRQLSALSGLDPRLAGRYEALLRSRLGMAPTRPAVRSRRRA